MDDLASHPSGEKSVLNFNHSDIISDIKKH